MSGDRKDTRIQIRVRERTHRTLADAAAFRGLSLSEWARAVLTAAANEAHEARAAEMGGTYIGDGTIVVKG